MALGVYDYDFDCITLIFIPVPKYIFLNSYEVLLPFQWLAQILRNVKYDQRTRFKLIKCNATLIEF